MNLRPVRRFAQVGIVGALITGVAGVAHFDKSVTLSVDGKSDSVHAFATTVADVLEDEGVEVGPHDVVVPSLDAKVTDGQQIVVRYGRKLSVTIDGVQKEYWTTATTVGAALAEMGVRADEAKLSASRSAAIGRDGLAVNVITPKTVTVTADGKKVAKTSTETDVKSLLGLLKIKVNGKDIVKPGLDTELTDGMKLVVTRVTTKTVKKSDDVAFKTIERADSSLYKGETRIITAGRTGTKVTSYTVVFHDGKEHSRKKVKTTVTVDVRNQVVAVGTKERPAPAPTTPPTGGGGGGGDTDIPNVGGLNWSALAQCESGGNPQAYNPAGYYGLYQFDLGTWASVGGSGLPTAASAAEQTNRAMILYGQRGASPWPVCGRLLFT